jgi:CubicO group peptidase (beta-lactamase class C family)
MKFLFALVLGATLGRAQVDLGQALDRARAEAGSPGAALAILHGGRIETRASGVASVETGAPVTAQSLFRIGSTTKMFTAAALAVLATKGRLDLQAPISTYAGDLPPELRALSLHQLLTHTAGIVDEAPMDGAHDESALAGRVRSLSRNAILAPPGRIFSYSNLGYSIAGYVLEQVYGKPFADAVRELVLEPCGMRSSTFRPLVAMTFPLALGHAPSPNGPVVVRPFADYAGAWPAGSLFTSVEDFSRFAQALLDRGRVDNRQALPSAAVALLETAHTNIPALGRGYGYGLQVYREDGGDVVRHTGGRTGYDSVLHLIPEKKTGVLVLVNRTGASMYSFAREVAQNVAGLSREREAQSPSLTAVSPAEAAKLAGKYGNGPSIAVELTTPDGMLEVVFGGRRYCVQRAGRDVYRAAGAGPLSEFRIISNANGSPEFLVAEVWALRRIQ